MTKSRIFLYFCISFVGGIFVSSVILIPQLLLLVLSILGILLISVFWKYKKFAVVGLCLLFLVAGIWRHQTAQFKVINNELRKYNDSGQVITLAGAVVKEPDIRSNNIKLTIQVQNIKSNENSSRWISERVLVTTNRYPEYQYGDKLKITGKLLTPKEFEDFNYKDYLAKEGVFSVMYWPKIELTEKQNAREQFSRIYGGILGFKNKLRESIYQNLPPPQSSILGAIILGDKRRISEEWKEKLNIAGVRHITAVSGMHVAILSSILMTLFLGLGLWRQQAFYFSIIFITLFVIMTGLQSSAVRAGIMGGLFLLAQHLGRQKWAANAISLAAVVMLIINPLLLKLDVGFQLSFLAMLGIIYLMPTFRGWLRFLPEKQFFNLRSILAMTISAQVFTLPILIYNFGYVSLVSLITNVLIVPLLPFIMGLGFIFGILGIIWQPLGWFLSLPAWLLLAYVTKIIDGGSGLPFAYLIVENFSWIWLIILYLILGYITWRLNQKQKLKFLNY